MALPARKLEPNHDPSRSTRPDLRVVRTPARKRSAKSSTTKNSRSAQRSVCRSSIARQNFRIFAVIVLVVAVLGMGRVWLSVLAAEASMSAAQLRHDIKVERYEGDMLEIQQSALGSPSRIRAIAGAAFDMAPAEDVTYIDISTTGAESVAAVSPKAAPRGGLARVMAQALDLAAGEAQVLLVGDVGLASAR